MRVRPQTARRSSQGGFVAGTRSTSRRGWGDRLRSSLDPGIRIGSDGFVRLLGKQRHGDSSLLGEF